jgi:hypothetical protein
MFSEQTVQAGHGAVIMNTTTRLTMAATMLVGLLGGEGAVVKADDFQFTRGYNAVQVGSQDGDLRMRAYTNIGVKNDRVHVDYQGLNEASPGYLFGRNSVRVGLNRFPLDAIVVSRIASSAGDAQLLDTAYGARIAMPKKTGLYGFVDVLRHSGVGVSDYRGLESVVFAGKRVKGWNFETTHAFKRGKRPYSEAEVLTHSIKRYGVGWRGFARYESPNHTTTFGLQGQF